MNRISTEVTTVERARWLAELAQALDEAQEVVKSFASAGGSYAETLDVSARLEAARAEVQSLRRSRMGNTLEEFDPKWIQHIPWDHAMKEQRALPADL